MIADLPIADVAVFEFATNNVFTTAMLQHKTLTTNFKFCKNFIFIFIPTTPHKRSLTFLVF